MKLIDQLVVPRNRGDGRPAVIQLLAGDLAALPARHAVDAVVVSAFPDSYTPNPGTLFESLFRRGLDMRRIADRRAEDQRSHLGCWISEPLAEKQARAFHFRRVICFEPRFPEFVRNSGMDEDSIEDTVGFVFRCLNNFILPEAEGTRRFDISRVAMPLLATGNQAVPVETMFPHLLDAAIFWLEEGLPIEQLKIVVFKPAHARLAGRIFAAVKTGVQRQREQRASSPAAAREGGWEARLAQTLREQMIQACQHHLREELRSVASAREKAMLERLFEKIERAASQPSGTLPGTAVAAPGPQEEYDLFISYAHKQDRAVKAFVGALKRVQPSTKVFYDRSSIPPGGQWIKLISDAVRRSRTFVAVLSPDYTASPVCWDEFQCAKLKEYNTRQPVIKTIRLHSEKELPPIMGIYSYIDCAEGDLSKLRDSAAIVLGGAPAGVRKGRSKTVRRSAARRS